MLSIKNTNELCWATDIHLDHASEQNLKYFANQVKARSAEFVVIGGDISNGVDIISHLKWLSNNFLNKKVAFVLGNHDYFGRSIDEVRKLVVTTCNDNENLIWLNRSGPLKLSENTALIGNGLWCDWRAGDYTTSNVWLADYQMIAEFYPLWGGNGLNKPVGFYTNALKNKVRQIADECAKDLKKSLEQAIDSGYKKIICVTHVPPFWEGSFYNGKVQGSDWAVHFVSHIAGEYIKEVMIANSDVNLTILCGHTHGEGKADILPNLHVINGSARYNFPMPQKPIYYY